MRTFNENEIITWDKSLEELKNTYKTVRARSNTPVRYNCTICGKDSVKTVSGILRINGFYCHSCALHNSHIKNYGTEENYKKAKLDNLIKNSIEKYGTKFPPQDHTNRQPFTEEEKVKINEKTKSTFIKKYGSLENLYKIRNDKTKETCLEKYGVESPLQNKDILQKVKDTNIKKYGVSCTLRNKEIRDKGVNTIKSIYGVDNVSKSEEIKKKKEETTLKHFGVKYPAQSQIVINTMKNNNIKNYGVDIPSKLINTIEKNKKTCLEKYGTEFSSQRFWTKEAIDIINDKNKFLNYILSQDLNKLIVADNLGVSKSTIDKYVKKYNLSNQIEWKTSKVSMPEREICNFIREKFPYLEIIRNTRDIIFPKELDIFIPEKSIAIEYNGSYWHDSKHINNFNHINKTNECKDKGIRLIHIFDFEYLNSKKYILNLIFNIISNTEILKTDKIIKLDLSKENPENYPEYKLIKLLPPNPLYIKGNKVLETKVDDAIEVFNCGYGIYERD